jgi:hypothetical protein
MLLCLSVLHIHLTSVFWGHIGIEGSIFLIEFALNAYDLFYQLSTVA